MKATIRRVYVERMLDEYPDLSHLGEYGNSPTSECAIDREARGDAGRNECRWFNPTMTGEQTGNPDSPEQDYQRMEAYNRGDWHMVGIRAVAEVVTASGTIQTLRSGGLWGIESDSGNDDPFPNRLGIPPATTKREYLSWRKYRKCGP